MKTPRLIYYNDAHHFNAKRIEPPASIHQLQWPVDEVVGTGVDLLVLGLGYADVYFHNSKVGRVVGQMKEIWANYIDWRIMRMVEEAQKLGTDQVQEVIKRGHKMGLTVFPSLKLQASSPPENERCGLLKLNHGAEVCIGEEGRAEWCYDFAHELVRQDKLAVLTEILEDYNADGIELDFMFDSYYFRQAEIEKNTPLMSRFVSLPKIIRIEHKIQFYPIGIVVLQYLCKHSEFVPALPTRERSHNTILLCLLPQYILRHHGSISASRTAHFLAVNSPAISGKEIRSIPFCAPA